MTRPRVLLADDHTLMLEGLCKLLEDQCDLVGTADNGQALLKAAERLRPDLIVLDISMPLLNGLEAARRLQTLVPGSKLIFLTMHTDPTYAREAFRAGASGYLLKRSASTELAVAIAAVFEGRSYLTPLISRDVAEAGPLPSLLGELTPRQREVLQLVAEGHTAKQIAVQLSISVKTVEFHKTRIMNRLELRTMSELTKYAIAHGITDVP